MYEILHIGLQLSIKWNWQLLNILTFHLEDNVYNSYQWRINNIRLFYYLHIKTVYIYNGIFAKINTHYNTITH